MPRTRLASACENWVFRASHTSVPREINDDLPGADFWESARFDLSDYRLVARHNFRVAVIRLACGLVSPLPVTSELGRPQQTCAPAVFFRSLPEAEWSPELNAKALEIAQTKVAMYDAYSSEMEQTASDETYLQQHRRSFGSRPIRILTSGNHGRPPGE